MLYLVEHKTFSDNRGSYTPLPLDTLSIKWNQCSISVNRNQFTFRGLHYQEHPRQTKYIKVVKGSIIDFGLDLETGKLDFVKVTENDGVLVPDNMAHGFLTLEPDTIVSYLVKGEYSPQTERSIVWSTVAEVENIIKNIIGENELTISEKDSIGK